MRRFSRKSFTRRRLAGLLAAFAALLALWSAVIEPSRVRFKEHHVFINNWPAELAGFSIAFLSDLHVGGPHIGLEKAREIVARTNARHPDLILLGGDYVQGVAGGCPVASRDIAAVLFGLRARHGVFGVLGNHDRWDDAARIEREFAARGIPMLENAAHLIQAGSEAFWLAGVADHSQGAHDVGKALSEVGDRRPVIVLTHSPDVFPLIPERVGLTLAGHTHGGQVYIPFLGRPVIPSKYGQRYALGLIRERGRQMFVSPGIGTSILPLRFLTPPEVSLLKLYPAPKPELP